MTGQVHVKICGLTRADDMAAAVDAGARYVGLVFFERSPRHLEFDQAARLARQVPAGLCKVALTVNADDAMLDRLVATVPVDMLQLHGRETPVRVAAIKSRYRLPVMKAVGVAEESDLAGIEAYLKVADQILIDAKPPKGAELPGGNGLAFDWRLIAGRRWPVPWMLAGGLTADTVAQAIRMTGARQVDVSSGVESAPGIKSPALIREFVLRARTVAS